MHWEEEEGKKIVGTNGLEKPTEELGCELGRMQRDGGQMALTQGPRMSLSRRHCQVAHRTHQGAGHTYMLIQWNLLGLTLGTYWRDGRLRIDRSQKILWQSRCEEFRLRKDGRGPSIFPPNINSYPLNAKCTKSVLKYLHSLLLLTAGKKES